MVVGGNPIEMVDLEVPPCQETPNGNKDDDFHPGCPPKGGKGGRVANSFMSSSVYVINPNLEGSATRTLMATQGQATRTGDSIDTLLRYNIVEGSLEVKLPTI